MSRPVTPKETTNGTLTPHSPQTPKVAHLSLTESSSTIPDSVTPKSKVLTEIPDAYLLPNGTPDV